MDIGIHGIYRGLRHHIPRISRYGVSIPDAVRILHYNVDDHLYRPGTAAARRAPGGSEAAGVPGVPNDAGVIGAHGTRYQRRYDAFRRWHPVKVFNAEEKLGALEPTRATGAQMMAYVRYAMDENRQTVRNILDTAQANVGNQWEGLNTWLKSDSSGCLRNMNALAMADWRMIHQAQISLQRIFTAKKTAGWFMDQHLKLVAAHSNPEYPSQFLEAFKTLVGRMYGEGLDAGGDPPRGTGYGAF